MEEENGADLHGWSEAKFRLEGTDDISQNWRENVFEFRPESQTDVDRNQMTDDKVVRYWWKVGEDWRAG